MAGKKYCYVMYYITYEYFFPAITYRYIIYFTMYQQHPPPHQQPFFRTFKKSTAPYKVHNMGLRRYIKYYPVAYHHPFTPFLSSLSFFCTYLSSHFFSTVPFLHSESHQPLVPRTTLP